MSLDEMIKNIVRKEVEVIKQEILSGYELNSPLVEVKEASELLGVSETVIYRMCRDGKLPHLRYGKDGSQRAKIKFRVIDLNKWIQEESQRNYRRESI